MGDPLQHSQSSAACFGGVPDDYLHIHTVMDSSKLFLADWRHRALLHNTFGIHMFEQLIGSSFKRKSDGKDVCIRTVVSQHILEDLGAIPTPGEFLREMPIKSWMAGIKESDKLRMQNLTIEGDGPKEAYITSSVCWNLYKNNKPDKTGYYIVSASNQAETVVLLFDATTGLWYEGEKLLEYAVQDTHFEYWAALPRRPVEK